MKNTLLLQSIGLAAILAIVLAIPSYGKPQRNNKGNPEKKADSGNSGNPAGSNTATNKPVSFTVRSSQINEGRWSQSPMNAIAGQLVEIRVTTIEELRNPKAKPGKIEFRAKGGKNSSCGVSFEKDPKAGQTKTTSLRMAATGPVEYSTEGSLSATVSMKLSGTSPDGSNGGAHGTGAEQQAKISTVTEQQAKNGLFLANWVWGQLGGYRNANMTGRTILPARCQRFFMANMMGNGYVTDGDAVIMGSPRSETIEAIGFSVEFVNKMGLVMVQSGLVYVGYGRNSDTATLLEVEAPGTGSMDGSFTVKKSLQERMLGDAFNGLVR